MRAIAFALDDNYIMPFRVLWRSLVDTDSLPLDLEIFVLHDETLSRENIGEIELLSSMTGRHTHFVDCRKELLADAPLSHHVSEATYFRLALANVLPLHIERVVYLDVDGLAVSSLQPLFEIGLSHSIAAVDHCRPKEALRLWGDMSGAYFQAGVLVIDLQQWRANGYHRVFQHILSNQGDRILWWDQDVLNIAFVDNWQRLPVWYNLCYDVRAQMPQDRIETQARFLHYNSSTKPWNSLMRDWSGQQWYDAYQRAFGAPFPMGSLRQPLTARLKRVWVALFVQAPRMVARAVRDNLT